VSGEPWRREGAGTEPTTAGADIGLFGRVTYVMEAGWRGPPAASALRTLDDAVVGLVLDDVQPLFAKPRDVVQHPLQNLGRMALPVMDLADHP
jgi:hypothetical protein